MTENDNSLLDSEPETGARIEHEHEYPECDNLATEYIDTHCHFDAQEFVADRLQLWVASQERGVKTLVIPGVEPEQWKKAKSLSHHYDGIYYALGVHPWWIEKIAPADLNQWQSQLKVMVSDERCVAIGECGLDATIAVSLAQQQELFEAHLRLAQELAKPLIIHSVKTHSEVLATLKKYELPAGGVIHAFSGSLEQAQAYWQQGFYLGIGGTITYARAKKTRNTVTAMPLASLVLETDAPFMPLFGHQGEANRPDLLPTIAQVLAHLRAQPLADIAQQTTRNAKQLFGWL